MVRRSSVAAGVDYILRLFRIDTLCYRTYISYSMNTPNKLTILRVIIAPIFMYFFLFDSFYMRMTALVLFAIAALTDLADGYYARKYGIVTGFGKFMDPLADKILVSCALISFIYLRYVSPFPVMLIIGREFAITGLRLLAAYRGVVIPPSWWAKVKTFLQLTVVGLVISYVSLVTSLEYFKSPLLEVFTYDPQIWFNLLLWLAAVVTILTGVDYIIKYFFMIKSVLK
ncbi:MAG: CDP-diacylglycerol--glycerol-3-phosphate 3-phosphatidyltransferase [candidate division Zixibacteria bacterium]|nr:CDP-diacylglycerol--glycerol-3-phosphate 3-phosphatidyltransferase [candidate division Zixibacteria bacterium]